MRELSKKMMMTIGVAAVAIVFAGGAFYRSDRAAPFALGVFTTSALNVLKVFMLEHTVNKAVGFCDAADGKNYIRGQYFVRFLLTGLVLAATAIAPDEIISLWGAAAGIFTFQIAAIAIKGMRLEESMEDRPPATTSNHTGAA